MSRDYERDKQQIAVAEQIRLARQSDPRRLAQKEAIRLFPYFRKIGAAIGNIGNIAETILAENVFAVRPVQLVGFYGVREKERPDSLDHRYIQRLGEIRDDISQVYEPGVVLTKILADSHGEFNGFLERNRRGSYLLQIKNLLQEAGLQTIWLSELYAKYGLTLPNSRDPFDKNPSDEAWAVFDKQREQYLESARKHHTSEAEVEAAAYWYVAMRLQERRMLRQEFPKSFLLVNGDPRPAKPLMPDGLPVIYLYEGPVWFKKGEPV